MAIQEVFVASSHAKCRMRSPYLGIEWSSRRFFPSNYRVQFIQSCIKQLSRHRSTVLHPWPVDGGCLSRHGFTQCSLVSASLLPFQVARLRCLPMFPYDRRWPRVIAPPWPPAACGRTCSWWPSWSPPSCFCHRTASAVCLFQGWTVFKVVRAALPVDVRHG